MKLFPKEFVPELNTKNLGNSTSLLTITHTTLSTKCLEDTDFDDRRCCCILFLDRTMAEQIFNF
jgi:hypothetical protein